MREAEHQKQVIELARLLGWRVAHFRPAQTSRGWRTAVAADGAGFPDLVLVRDGFVIFAELKTDKGRLSMAQVTWIDSLGGDPLGVQVQVDPKKIVATWRPKDWDIIEGTLRVFGTDRWGADS